MLLQHPGGAKPSSLSSPLLHTWRKLPPWATTVQEHREPDVKGKGHRRQDKAPKPGGTTAGLVFPAPICLLFPILLIHTWPLSLHDQEQRKEGHPSDPSSSTCYIHRKGLM